MLKTNASNPQVLERVCIRCGDANLVSLRLCHACGFDLTSDLQRDYDFYRDGIPLDRPSGVGERQGVTEARSPRERAETHPGMGHVTRNAFEGEREGSGDCVIDTEKQATMDLGAAVLEAVYAPQHRSSKRTEDMDTLDLFSVELPEDPVAWSPSKGMHIETPVVINQEAPSAPIQDTPDEAHHRVVGAIQDWSVSQDDITQSGVLGTSGASSAHTQRKVEAEHTKETLRATDGPATKRNHIRKGATTYVDALQSSVRISETGWWPRDAALPFAIAVGLVTLVLFALM